MYKKGILNVTGENSIEIFTTNNKVVYVSQTFYVSNELTRVKDSY